MKTLGIVRKLDELGRVVIPMEVRRANGWAAGAPLEMFGSEDGLVIRKYAAGQEKEELVNDLKAVLSEESKTVSKAAIEKAIKFIEEN